MGIGVPTQSFTPSDGSTSGTVGQTVIDTILVIEHAARRCMVSPSNLTPENLDMAKNNLHFILAKLSNRGVNLWAVEEYSVPVVAGKITYALPGGTESILNSVFRKVSRLQPVTTTLTGQFYCGVVLAGLVRMNAFGFELPADVSSRFVLESSVDGVTWDLYENFNDITLAAGWHWYTLDPAVQAKGFRVRDSSDTPLTVLDVIVSTEVVDTPMTTYNRDTYTNLPNKATLGLPTGYFHNKKIESSVAVWPTGIDDLGQLVFWCQRRVQDVGSLSQKLEVPERWFDSIIWSLAKLMAFELPNVAADRITLCINQEAAALSEAELGESDGAPMFIQPNISGYTR